MISQDLSLSDTLEKFDSLAQGGQSIGGQAPAMDPITVERFLDEPGRSAAVNQADCTFPVGPAPHRLVESADADERGAAHGRSRAEATIQNRRALIRDIERARLLEATN